MTLKLYAFTCGTVTGEFAHLMEGGEGDITVPVPVFLIEHPKGRALFDTGLHPDCQHDPVNRLGERLAGLFRIGFQPGEEISAHLEAIDRDPGKIDLIINSHFHFDHVGGNALIPNATLLVQRREWEAGMNPEIAARRGFNRRDFDLGHKLRLVDGEHDVFGDGSVVCLPTHGHTPGHQSLRLRLAHGEIVLAADACYFCQTLRERKAALASFSATTLSSGKRYRKRRCGSVNADPRSFSVKAKIAQRRRNRVLRILPNAGVGRGSSDHRTIPRATRLGAWRTREEELNGTVHDREAHGTGDPRVY
jgi:glyoxylase-like metal-dependent hydrolase (beta-lactamase superfamily II)